MDSSDILARVRAGDTEAFASIVGQFQSPIVHYLFRLTGDAELARDLAQDTFMQAFRGLSGKTPVLSLKAWLYRIATNNAFQHRRRTRKVSFVPLSEDPDVHAHEDDVSVAVHEALLKVPEKLRTCLVLHFVDGFKYREIAETLGISEDAVRMRVVKGRDSFRRHYSGGGDET